MLTVLKTTSKWKRDIKAKDKDNDPPINHTMQQLIQDFNLPILPSNPYFGSNVTANLELLTPLRNLQTRLQAYLAMVDTTPRRQEPSPGISTTTMHDVTAQVSIELGETSRVPRHLQTVLRANRERGIFDKNLIDHHRLFQHDTSTSSSTRSAPVPLTQLMDPAHSEDEDDDVPDLNDNSDSDDDGGPTRASKIKAALAAPRVVYMNASNMEVIPGKMQSTPRRKRPKYTPGSAYRYSSPPTQPTHVHMVSMPEERNDGYTTSSQAYVVETKSATQSQSQSTTPEETTSRCPSNDESRG
jgi:hypothetical protein